MIEIANQKIAQIVEGIKVMPCIALASLWELVVAEIKNSVCKSKSAFRQHWTARKLRKKWATRLLDQIATKIIPALNRIPVIKVKVLTEKKAVKMRIKPAVR